MKKVLVTGATGAIGRMLVKRLVDLGFSVRVFVRSGTNILIFPEGVHVFEGNLLSERDLDDACSDIDIVFHLAAKLHINNPLPSEEKEIFRVNRDATRLICRSSWKKGVARLVFFSTINVYGVSEYGQAFDESSPVNPLTAYAESKLEAEKYVLGLCHRHTGHPCGIVLRYAAVYGPNMKGNYRLLSGLAGKGLCLLPGDLQNRRTIIHEDNAVDAAILTALNPGMAGKIFNITDGKIHTLEAIYSSMLEMSGYNPSVMKLPLSIVKPLLKLMDLACGLFLNKTPFMSALNKFTEDMAVEGTLLIKEAGFNTVHLIDAR